MWEFSPEIIGSISFQTSYYLRDGYIRLCLDKKMYMVRHDLHGIYSAVQFIRLEQQQFLQSAFDLIGQEASPVLRTEDNMIRHIVYTM